ncbi:MAG: hypothetical protein NZM04_05710 [Methylacidiphilales bacterium]|nr:hypothetical protein [Candidatus Methylacidiphilales bacterium]
MRRFSVDTVFASYDSIRCKHDLSVMTLQCCMKFSQSIATSDFGCCKLVLTRLHLCDMRWHRDHL